MPQFLYLPWCHLDKSYQVGSITLIPFTRDQPIDDLEKRDVADARLILRSYKNMSGLPVRHAVFVKYEDRGIMADLSEPENSAVREFVQIAAFAGLASREYFTQNGNYCNADCFRMIQQCFIDEPSVSGIKSRRVDGGSTNGIAIAELSVSAPPHVNQQQVKLDEPLIQALCTYRTVAQSSDWARWLNAISCFNHANTDDSGTMYQVEWVLLCSAFEHLLDAESKANDVAMKFVRATTHIREILAINSRRKLDRWPTGNEPLRQEWMREFYRIRGDFAHGRLMSRQPCAWQPYEHLFLSAVAFPLLVRCMLSALGHYHFGESDKHQLFAFEAALDGDCFARITATDSCNPFLWPTLLCQARDEQFIRHLQDCLEGKAAQE